MLLHRLLLISRFVFLLCLLFPFQAQGGEALYTGEKAEKIPFSEPGQKLNFGFEADFASQYVWRGIALSDGPVLQPSTWLSFYGATASVWGNFVLNDEPNQGEFNEVDFNLAYNYQYKRLIVQPMVFFYVFPNQDTENTGEGGLAIGIELGDFKLFTAHLFDIVASPGAYFGLVGVSLEKEIRPEFSLKTVLGFGWADGEFNDINLGVPESAANVFLWSVDLNWYVYDLLYLRPHMKITSLLDQTVRDSVESPTIVSGGLAIGVEF